jgi:cell division protein FtsI/penicillin-binding protein 2
VIIGREAAENQEIPGTRVLSQQVAMEIGRMMEEVCLTGTAAGAQVNTFIAGKTGSAESSTPDGETVHGWFTGYFPAEQPTYTVTVFVENGKTGSGSALPVFEKIVNWLNP